MGISHIQNPLEQGTLPPNLPPTPMAVADASVLGDTFRGGLGEVVSVLSQIRLPRGCSLYSSPSLDAQCDRQLETSMLTRPTEYISDGDTGWFSVQIDGQRLWIKNDDIAGWNPPGQLEKVIVEIEQSGGEPPDPATLVISDLQAELSNGNDYIVPTEQAQEFITAHSVVGFTRAGLPGVNQVSYYSVGHAPMMTRFGSNDPYFGVIGFIDISSVHFISITDVEVPGFAGEYVAIDILTKNEQGDYIVLRNVLIAQIGGYSPIKFIVMGITEPSTREGWQNFFAHYLPGSLQLVAGGVVNSGDHSKSDLPGSQLWMAALAGAGYPVSPTMNLP